MARGRTRRDFLAAAARAAAGASVAGLGGCFPDVGGSWPQVGPECADDEPITPVAGASRVVEVHREDSVVDGAVNAAAMRPMLDAALAALTDGAADPWRLLLPDYTDATRIGLKVNCLNEYLPTTVPLVAALVASLRDGLGIAPERLIVWDRRLDELSPAPPRRRFDAETVPGATIMGTWSSLEDWSGPGYTDALCGEVEGKVPRLSRILTDLTDLTINCPVLKTHGVSGVTGAMKNIYGIIHNPGDYHRNLVTALPALYRLPPIRRHIRLNVLDALVAVTTGGTSSPPDAYPKRILVSADALALDNYALALVNQLRADKGIGLPDVDPTLTTWLGLSHELGLGALDYELVTA